MANHHTPTGIARDSRILVADDYEVNQKIAQLILQKSGYDVDLVENGQQAVEACQQNHYDLVLMDIQMPVMDGHEATKKIRNWECGMRNKIGKKSEFKRIPIIAMTGNAADGCFDEKRYPGMNGCIGKPLQRDFLLSVVQKWIRAESKTQTKENTAAKTRPADKKPEENQLPLDLDRAIKEFMGQKEILFGVLQEFVTRAGSQIVNIRQAVKGADYGAIGSEAHAIKGGAANLTADKLARLASNLEQAAEAQHPDLSAELADKLEQELYFLESYIQQISGADHPASGHQSRPTA